MNKIILSQILLSSIEGRATARKLADTLFDSRTDLVVCPRTTAIAAALSFYNEGWNAPGNDRGIRRRLTLILTDGRSGARISSKTVTLKAARSDVVVNANAFLPFRAGSMPLDRDYCLIVMDTATGLQLGCRTFRMLPHEYCGRSIEHVYSVDEAGLTTVKGIRFFSSLDVRPGTYAAVRFNLQYEPHDPLEKVPEAEIRLYFPDGSFTHRFLTPERDDYDMGLYHVSMPFLSTYANRGIVYAELLVNDTATAGIVFRTEGDEAEGALKGKSVHILDEYTPEAANQRFEAQSELNEFSEDDFDRRLDEFIRCATTGTSEDDEVKEAEEEPDTFGCELQQLVGLDEVKRKLTTYEKLMNFNAMRGRAGLPVVSTPLHAMFLGSPGTGKTTVAKMVGRILHGVGLLSKGHVVVRERATLSGTHYGDHEDLTLKALEEAKGGILFIDEAYQLFQHNDPKDPGRLVLETLLTALADEDNRDWMLILAGYPDEMMHLFCMNPGLRSRIPEANIYTFADFSEPELMEIAERWFARNRFHLTDEARAALATRLSADYSARDKSFGNARHVVNLIETAILPSMATRVMDEGAAAQTSLTDILPTDIPAPAIPAPRIRRIGFTA